MAEKRKEKIKDPQERIVNSLKDATEKMDEFIDSETFGKVIPSKLDREEIRKEYKSSLKEWYSEYSIEEANEKADTFIKVLWSQAAVASIKLAKREDKPEYIVRLREDTPKYMRRPREDKPEYIVRLREDTPELSANSLKALKAATEKIDELIDSETFGRVMPDELEREKIRETYKSSLKELYSEYSIEEANEKADSLIKSLELYAAVTSIKLAKREDKPEYIVRLREDAPELSTNPQKALKDATEKIDEFIDSETFGRVIPNELTREKIREKYKSSLKEWYSKYSIEEANEKADTLIKVLWSQATDD